MRRLPPYARSVVTAAVALVIAAGLPLVGALGAGSAIPALGPAPRPHGDAPMRIVRVMSSDKACEPDCPEWISAEGTITPGTAAAFARLVADLGGRRLPVLISSHGGSLRDALEMGVLIRSRNLAVAVARTLIANCPSRARGCADARGQATVDGAACASACPLVLAGGVARLIGPAALIGVHQITTVVKEPEGVEGVTRTVKLYEQGWVDETVETYLRNMSVGDPVMSLLRRTPAASIRWLSVDEIKASGLATGALDPAEPILAAAANGLNGSAFGQPATPDVITGKIGDRDGLGALLTLTYRRGGGALELAVNESSQRAEANATDWTATAAGGTALALTAEGQGRARALMPRARFCALSRDGRIVATPAPTAAGALRTVTFDVAAATGVRALFDEACP